MPCRRGDRAAALPKRFPMPAESFQGCLGLADQQPSRQVNDMLHKSTSLLSTVVNRLSWESTTPRALRVPR